MKAFALLKSSAFATHHANDWRNYFRCKIKI